MPTTTIDDCIFCKIVEKKNSAKIIYEDEHVIAFLDIHPRAPGHTMVIPKVHAPNLLELPDEEVAPLFTAVKQVAALVSWRLHADGITMGVNQGRASGQEVDHLHVHLLPRWKDDGGGAIQSVVNNQRMGTVDEIYAKLMNP
jgi:histidine triad (HIT) family protein